MLTIEQFREASASDPLQIRPGIWWVGNHRDGEMFQAHSYLIDAGTDSVLIDPGSESNFRQSLTKIERVMPFANIRYFVCQHADPDISAALPLIDRMVRRDDARIVTHWRSAQLLRHYDVTLPFLCVEANDWRLDAAGRRFDFIFTPYAHFPGAFVTLDARTATLFSSDLFGGHTEGFDLIAEDESYFEALRPFHEHYMPSREVLINAMARIEQHEVEVIAPQHGSLIRGRLVPYMIEKLKGLECGLFLLAPHGTDIERLRILNRVLRETIDTMILYREFNSVAVELTRIMAAMVPVDLLEFYVSTHAEGELRFAPSTRYRGIACTLPPLVAALIGTPYDALPSVNGRRVLSTVLSIDEVERDAIVVALPPTTDPVVTAVAVIVLARPTAVDDYIAAMIGRMEVPLQVALERETIYRVLELEKQRIYARSVRDPLTNCYNRTYMADVLERQFERHDRGQEGSDTTIAMIDIDHFKSINDSFGHNCGDEVLRRIGGLILDSVRGGDMAVRLGGEEFAVFMFGRVGDGTAVLAERIRQSVEAMAFASLGVRRITISAGIAIRHQGETIEAFIGRADQALYRAKQAGRNRIVVS